MTNASTILTRLHVLIKFRPPTVIHERVCLPCALVCWPQQHFGVQFCAVCAKCRTRAPSKLAGDKFKCAAAERKLIYLGSTREEGWAHRRVINSAFAQRATCVYSISLSLVLSRICKESLLGPTHFLSLSCCTISACLFATRRWKFICYVRPALKTLWTAFRPDRLLAASWAYNLLKWLQNTGCSTKEKDLLLHKNPIYRY